MGNAGSNKKLNTWVKEVADLCRPDATYWCNGSKEEYDCMMKLMLDSGMAIPFRGRSNNFLFRSDPSDVARVEDRTYISTLSQDDAGPTNNWLAPSELKETMTGLCTGCMTGRTMYVIPFSMGPIGSPIAKIGVEITDSPYVVTNMHIMTRVGSKVLDVLGEDGEFISCLHSIGAPLAEGQVESVYKLMNEGRYSVIDYELLFLTPDHEDHVKSTRRHSYLDDQRHRLEPTSCPVHLSCEEIKGVPYIHGHAESTGGHLWVVGRNSRLFDYFLPERWRKTPSLSLSSTNEVFCTVTKDNIHLVWKTSRVGESLDNLDNAEEIAKISRHGINSPFEEFAVADELNRLGIHAVYPRAIYRTGSMKIEKSNDLRKYESHNDILDSEGKPILIESHNYITIRGYYNGPDEWVPEHEDALYRPIDLPRALTQGIIDDSQLQSLHQRVVERLREAGYDGTMLKSNDLLLAVDHKGEIMKNSSGELDVIICNFEFIWKMADSG